MQIRSKRAEKQFVQQTTLRGRRGDVLRAQGVKSASVKRPDGTSGTRHAHAETRRHQALDTHYNSRTYHEEKRTAGGPREKQG